MAKYAAGEKVKFTGMVMPATIISGPHPTHGAERYLIRKADETVSLVKVGELSPLLTRREAVAKVAFENTAGRRWETLSTYSRSGWFRLADKILAAAEDAAAEEKARPLANGDKIRILRTGLEFASVEVGDILTVMSVGGTSFNTNCPGRGFGSQWSFRLDGEGKGWERV
jgi:hypothetical protein